jgi:tetratricopeptide (TPR) repeat protein
MRLPSLLLALLLALSTSAALAKPEDPDVVQAKQHYRRGLAHFNLKEYDLAIGQFEKAYRLHPDSVFLYNLGQSHRLAEHHDQALHFYRAYLRAEPRAANKRDVEGRIGELEKVIAAKQAIARPPDNTISPGEKPAVTPAPAEAPPAAVTIEAAPVATRTGERTPLYKKWWLWTIVGVVVVGASVGAGVGVATSSPKAPNAFPAVTF